MIADQLYCLWVAMQAQVEFEAFQRNLRGEHLIEVTLVSVVDGERVETEALYLESNDGG